MSTVEQLNAGADAAALSDDLQKLHDDMMQAIQRDINVLGETTSDRSAKRRSLEHIHRETLGRPGLPASPADARLLARVFAGIVRPVLRVVGDPVEKCRELSTQLIAGFARRIDSVVPFLPYIVPTLTERLSPPEIAEPSEDQRLLMVRTLVEIVRATGSEFAPFVEDTVKALTRTLADPYPEVKKESCKLVIELCKSNERPVAFHGDAIAKAVLPILHHRHSSVRAAGVEALAASILVEASGLDASLDALHAVSNDKAPGVREALYRAAKLWLMELRDRYTYAYKTLPLILTGMTDDMPKLRDLASTILNEVGQLYETEWESRIKDEMDYTDGWDHLPNRPRVGLRHLARDNMQKIITKMVEGMNDWNVETRIKSSQVLAVFLTLTEDQATGYIGSILPALYKLLSGDDQASMAEAAKVAKTIGLYIKPDVTFSLLFPQLAMGAGGATHFRLECLRTLHGLLAGAGAEALSSHIGWLMETLGDRDIVQSENLQVLIEVGKCVLEVVNKVPFKIANHHEIATIPSPTTTTTAATFAASKLTSTDSANTAAVAPSATLTLAETAFRAFMILLHLESVSGDDRVPGYADLRALTTDAKTALVHNLGIDSPDHFYQWFLDPSITALTATHNEWTKHATDLRLFDTLMMRAGPSVASRLSSILPIMYSCAKVDREYEVRERIAVLMSRLARNPASPLSNNNGSIVVHSIDVIKQIVLPGCIWRAGRKAAVLRMHSMDLFLALLTSNDQSTSNIQESMADATESSMATHDRVGLITTVALDSLLQSDVLPVVISNIEDDDATTRQTSLSVLNRLLSTHLNWQASDYKKLYPELIKRMDDAQDTLRIQCANVWITFFKSVSRWQNRVASLRVNAEDPSLTVVVQQSDASASESGFIEIGLDNVHWQSMVKGLAIHMDDTNSAVQESACEVLKTGTQLCIPRQIVREELNAVRPKHRGSRFIDAVLAV